MYNVHNYEYDCTRKCKCRSHGQKITAALTKRGIANNELAAYIAKTCCNFAEITDPLGRTAVHMAASVDRYAILEWLLNQGAVINCRDKESGSSPLHRAIYYGCIDCAVLLLRYGGSLELLDEDKRSPVQNCCRLCDFSQLSNVPSNNELLVWGSNKNYNLGIGNEEGATAPQFIDLFRKQHISIEMVSLSTYHSLFVTERGHLYAVGHGKGGRLGNGTENSQPVPRKIKVPIKNDDEKIICVSTSKNHSLLLTNRSTVFACGLNENKQLGIRDAPEKLTVFKEVVSLRDFHVEDLTRVIARDYHSLVYSSNKLYVWGTNYGQFGIKNTEAFIPLPRAISLPNGSKLVFVESNNFAIACYLHAQSGKTVLLYYGYKIRAIKPPEMEALKSISIVGGENTKTAKGNVSALKLCMLTETNVMFIWYEINQQYMRCTFSPIGLSQIDKIFYKANQVLILSKGDVYTGKCRQIQDSSCKESSTDAWLTQAQARKDVCTEQKIRIELNRISHLDRAVDVFCDDDFSSFAVLQESYAKYFTPPTLVKEQYNFKKLLNDVSESDGIHDVVFHVDGEIFCAHKFIIFSRSAGLRSIVESYPDKDIYLNFKGLTAKMFEIVLKNIYTNYFISERDIDDIEKSFGPDCPVKSGEVLDLFLDFVEKFELSGLANFIKRCGLWSPAEESKYRFNRLKRGDYQNLHDVTIRCAGDVEVSAHKCILVSRLEYFELMFNHTWSEKTTINLTTVPAEYMIPIVDFLYTSDAEHFRKLNHSETFLYNMVVFCDQFFIERLRKVCEILILERINIRKCGEMLDFACIYNCDILKTGCMDFICQNLYRVLSQRSLECCEPEVLKCINAHYRQMFKEVFDYRMITPDSEAVDDEVLLSFVSDFEVDLDYRMDEEEVVRTQSKHKLRESKMKQSTRQYEKDAINSMREMSLQDSMRDSLSEKSKALKEAEEVSASLHSESKAWTKVAEKKEVKKKPLIAPVVRANEVLKAESKPKEEFVNLSQPVEKATPTESTPVKGTNFNLADFTPIKSEKLSQKQRKRLSSESWRSEPLASPPTKPIAVPQPQTPNAWGITSPVATGSELDTSSFANIMRSPSSLPQDSPTKRMGAAPSTSGTSFTQILEDEKKQREYVDRMRNKSLVLTQIEETAIAELRDFYNVDNADDEIITIDRKTRPVTMNFATWQKN